MIEESESQGGEAGRGAQPAGPGSEPSIRRTEGDLLAERRARRAAEGGEVILTRRAEAAEATVQTLERHVTSLQQRLLDAEEDLRRTAELLEIEKAAALEREHELRRVKQREYAEQQLRVETEDRLTNAADANVRAERESRAESERLSLRLNASEQDGLELAQRLESLQRQLAEAEQAAAAERAAVQRAEAELQKRLGDLESRTERLQQGLDGERVARERSEALIEGIRHGHQRMETLVGEMRGIVERLTTAITVAEIPSRHAAQGTIGGLPTEGLEPRPGPPAATSAQAGGVEMADALAAAVERLRARAEAAAVPEQQVLRAPVTRIPHKHSMSLIGRWRNRRKQRRNR